MAAEEAFEKLKAVLPPDSKILAETPPSQLCFRQGSLWGITPRTAKKTVEATLKPQSNDQTTFQFSSKLTSDWVNVTLVGCVLAAVLSAVCVWMAMDLSVFLVNGNPSVWSWIVTDSGGRVLFQTGEAFVNLSWGLAIFLLIIIVTEAVVYVWAKNRVDITAEDVLAQLT